MTFPAIDSELVAALYAAYESDLKEVRRRQLTLYETSAYPPLERLLREALPFGVRNTKGDWIWSFLSWVWLATGQSQKYMFPCFSDLESEVTYLLVRHSSPGTLVEISPAGGWSTSWILSAMRDNGTGRLYSFDINDHSQRLLPHELTEGRWTFCKGDVRDRTDSIPSSIDFVFLDSLHSAAFAQWYLAEVLSRLSAGAVVVIDDIFLASDLLFTRKARGVGQATEPDVVLSWLRKRQQRFFTLDETFAPAPLKQILETRDRLGIQGHISRCDRNPALFFRY